MAQTALFSYNNHDWFNQTDFSVLINAVGFDLTGKHISVRIVPYDFTTAQTIMQNSAASLQRFGIGINANQIRAVVYDGTYYSSIVNISAFEVGDVFNIEVDVIDYSTAPILTVNGLPSTGSGIISIGGAGFGVGGRMVATPDNLYLGLIPKLEIDAVSYTAMNSYQGGATFNGTRKKAVAMKDPNNPDFDLFGASLEREFLTNGFSFSGQDSHHVDLTAITPNNNEWLPVGTPVAGRMTRDAVGDTDVYCFKVAWNGAQPILSDSRFLSEENSSNRLQNNRNGQVIASTNTVDLYQWYFILDTQQSGARQLYIGTDTIAPTEVGTAGGFMNAATQGMILGNSAAAAIDSLNGELISYLHYTKSMTLEEAVEIWNSIKSQMK